MDTGSATSKAAVVGIRILGYLLLALLLPAVLISGLVVVLCEDVNRWLGAGVDAGVGTEPGRVRR